MLGDLRQVLLHVRASRSSFQNSDSTYVDSQGYTERSNQAAPKLSMTVTCCYQSREPPFFPPSFPCAPCVTDFVCVCEVERRMQAADGGVWSLESYAAATLGLWQHGLLCSVNHSFGVIQENPGPSSSCPLTQGEDWMSVETVLQSQEDLLERGRGVPGR